MSQKPAPSVYLLDDDPAFLYLMEHVLKKLGLDPEGFTGPEPFLERMRAKLPKLCLIDLSLGTDLMGFEVIYAIRAAISENVPIIVISSDSEPGSVAHAIETGANDYLFKPLDRELLLAKVSSYVSSPQISDTLETGAITPEVGTMRVWVGMDAKISRIEETGVTVVSRQLITKGTMMQLRGGLLDDIAGPEAMILATVIATSIDTENRYAAYLEFDSSQPEVSNQVRTWILKQRPSATSQ